MVDRKQKLNSILSNCTVRDILSMVTRDEEMTIIEGIDDILTDNDIDTLYTLSEKKRRVWGV